LVVNWKELLVTAEKFTFLGDIDIDASDRKKLLSVVKYIPASIVKNNKYSLHNSGVYFHQVPVHPFLECCSLSYDVAEDKNCYKIDILNNSIYSGVKSEAHLSQLMSTPPMWELLEHQEVVKQLAHINSYFDLVKRLKPQSTTQLAMILALIRPGKRHLVSKCQSQGWDSLEPEIWSPDPNQNYSFKKAHAISLAVAIQVQLNLLVEIIASGSYSVPA
jgi:hypothetical protein